MAKIILGPIVSECRNRQGNLVYSRNTHGAFIRSWFVPPYRNSAQQAALRTAFRNATKRWSSALSETQRSGWRAFASAHPIIDKFGNQQLLDGHQYYVRINQPKFRYTAAYLDAPPTNALTLPITSLTWDLNYTAHHFWVGWTPTPNTAPYWLIIACSPKRPVGVNFFGDHWCFIAQYGAATNSPVDIFTPYTDYFGWPGPGWKIAVRVSRLNNLNGHMSAAQVAVDTTY